MNRTATIATLAGLAVGAGVLLALIVHKQFIVHQLKKSAIKVDVAPPQTSTKRERPRRKLEVDESNPLFTRKQ